MAAKRIVVVGGGPAGMMAAIRASALCQDVTLIEKNPHLGRKLLLSGKGRCNLTNACDLDSFLKRFSGNGQFLRGAFNKFFNLDLMRFFEERGLKLKTERQLRVFPQTNRSGSVVAVLKQELGKNKVKILYKATMKDILLENNRVRGILLAGGRVIPADGLILATGGVSFSFTGSTGDGHGIAQRLGHRIVAFRPGLVGLNTQQSYPALLEGLTLKNIRLTFGAAGRELKSPIGELLFTRSGISGPLVLSLSGQVADWLQENISVYVEIDLKPALSKEQLHLRLLRELKFGPKKTFRNMLGGLMPKKLAQVFAEIAGTPAEKKTSQVTKAERESLVSLLKGWRLDIASTRPIEEAMITRGGVLLKEIDPRTMQSRLVAGLYFAGEIIDVDADTGGFNLQAAFSTGYLAGESAALN